MVDSSNTGVFEPVAAPSTYEQTVQRLGTAIRIGILQPGSRLPPERELADHLDISRSTLRQALASLTDTGHLIAVRGRTGGTFVAAAPPIASGRRVDTDRARALLDWRMALELGTVELAAERATDAQRAALEALANECRDQDEWADFRRHDAQFHLRIAEAAHSERVVEAMTRLQGELSDMLQHIDRSGLSIDTCADQHEEVASAVARGDVGAARDAMRAHLSATERCFDGALS